MPEFTFVVPGPPVSLNVRKKNAKRHREWVNEVREAALAAWPVDQQPTTNEVVAVISNYFTAAPPDIDNIIKPILDALKGVVYKDDDQVQRVTSQKFDLTLRLKSSDALLESALDEYDELVHVEITWEA